MEIQTAIDKVFDQFDTFKYKVLTDELWRICNDKDLYTCGSVDHYNNMFQRARKATSFKDVYEIRNDIWYHSDMEELEKNGFTMGNLLDLIISKAVIRYE